MSTVEAVKASSNWRWEVVDTETKEKIQSDYCYLTEQEAQEALLYFLSDG